VLPVWLNRAGARWERDSPPPALTISSLVELPDALRGQRRVAART
jgi:hypothetical protein